MMTRKLMNERLQNMMKGKAAESRAEDKEAGAVVIKKRGRPPKVAAVQTASVHKIKSIVQRKF
jgi:hypothetical protein